MFGSDFTLASTVYALQGIDYVLMCIYLVAIIGLGIYIGRGIKSEKDYFLAGKKLPWWAIGMSMVVSDIGAVDIVGLAGAAFVAGLVVSNFDFIGCVPVMILAGFVFIPFLWRSGSYTVPEFLGKRYNQGVRVLIAIIWGIFLACNLGIMLFATAKVMNLMLGWDIATSIIVAAVATGLYTYTGGLAAVVYTDVIQCAVMIIGCTIALGIGLYEVGGPVGLMDTIHSMGPQYQDHFKLILPVDTKTPYPWTGILFGLAMVLAPAYWIGNQQIVQRCLGARSEYEAKAAMVWGSLLKISIPILMVIPGLIALAKYPTLPSGDDALPTLLRDILPTGILGIFFAAFLAALMSSVDSCINSSATIFTRDIYQGFIKKDGTDEHYLKVGRAVTIVCILWGIGFAFYVQGSGDGIFSIFQTLLALFQGPSLAIIVLGILWWRTTGKGAFVGLLGGVLFSTTLHVVNESAEKYEYAPIFQIDDPFLYIAFWSFVVSMVLTVGVSLLTEPEPEEKIKDLVYGYKRRDNNAESV